MVDKQQIRIQQSARRQRLIRDLASGVRKFDDIHPSEMPMLSEILADFSQYLSDDHRPRPRLWGLLSRFSDTYGDVGGTEHMTTFAALPDVCWAVGWDQLPCDSVASSDNGLCREHDEALRSV